MVVRRQVIKKPVTKVKEEEKKVDIDEIDEIDDVEEAEDDAEEEEEVSKKKSIKKVAKKPVAKKSTKKKVVEEDEEEEDEFDDDVEEAEDDAEEEEVVSKKKPVKKVAKKPVVAKKSTKKKVVEEDEEEEAEDEFEDDAEEEEEVSKKKPVKKVAKKPVAKKSTKKKVEDDLPDNVTEEDDKLFWSWELPEKASISKEDIERILLSVIEAGFVVVAPEIIVHEVNDNNKWKEITFRFQVEKKPYQLNLKNRVAEDRVREAIITKCVQNGIRYAFSNGSFINSRKYGYRIYGKALEVVEHDTLFLPSYKGTLSIGPDFTQPVKLVGDVDSKGNFVVDPEFAKELVKAGYDKNSFKTKYSKKELESLDKEFLS